MSLAAHLQTVWPVVRQRIRPQAAPAGEAWSLVVDDPKVGPVRLSGALRRPPGATTLVVFVHGLGGHRDSRYVVRAARVADALGLAALRLDCRGSDRRGEDVYHAGLSSDLAAVVASPALAGFERILLFGFSLGGHLVLRFATETGDPRVAAAAAVSAPLDLDASSAAFDRPSRWVYRRYILGGLASIYAAYAARRPDAVPAEVVRRARTIRDFDRLVVVPRFGFASPEDYYARESVGPRLGGLRVPSLLVAAPGDPMVDVSAVRPVLDAVRPAGLEVRWVAGGGHVGFPADLDLGLGGPRGIDGQVLGWLLAAGAPRRRGGPRGRDEVARASAVG